MITARRLGLLRWFVAIAVGLYLLAMAHRVGRRSFLLPEPVCVAQGVRW